MKNKKILENRIRTTITFGYGLFIINLIAAIFGAISFSSTMLDLGINNFDADMFLLFIISGTVLPTLISYVIGDRTAHAKNTKLHHYNGVLFGLAAYWLAMLSNSIWSLIQTLSTENTPFILEHIISACPILATVAIMTFVAVIYNRKPKNNKTMLQYLPYQIVLFSAAIGTIMFGLLSQYLTNPSFDCLSIIPILFIVILVAISYKVMPKNDSSTPTHIAQSVVAVTIGLISIALASQLAYPLGAGTGTDIATPISYVCGLTIWIIYLRLMSRKL